MEITVMISKIFDGCLSCIFEKLFLDKVKIDSCRYLQAAIALSILLSIQSVRVQGSETDAIKQLNCVDSSVISYCKCMGKNISVGTLQKAIGECGLDTDVFFRPLNDCRSILKRLGIPVEAVLLPIDINRRLPTPSIVYSPSSLQGQTGHVFVVESLEGDRYKIWDPAIGQDGQTVDFRILQLPDQVVVLISSSVVQRLWVIRSVKTLAIIGFLVGIAPFFLRFLGRHFNKTWKISGIAVALAGLVGCENSSLERNEPHSSLVHDLGVVQVQKRNNSVGSVFFSEHRFILKNENSIPFKITGVASGCSCVIPSKYLIDTIVPANSSVEIPVSIDLTKKIGFFAETIVVEIESPTKMRRTLVLKGFAQHSPHAETDVLELFSFDGKVVANEVRFTYLRPSGGAIPNIIGCHINAQSGSDCSGLKVLSRKKQVVLIGQLGEIVDAWDILLTYKPNGHSLDGRASLEVAWDKPGGACSSVPIRYGKRSPVEISDYWYLPSVFAGRVHVELLPVKIHAIDSASLVSFVCGESLVTCELLPSKKRLRLEFSSLPEGPFSFQVSSFVDGVEGDPIKIEGIAI